MAELQNPIRQVEDTLVDLTAKVVAAYVSENVVPVAELPAFISDVHRALRDARAPGAGGGSAEPAVPSGNR